MLIVRLMLSTLISLCTVMMYLKVESYHNLIALSFEVLLFIKWKFCGPYDNYIYLNFIGGSYSMLNYESITLHDPFILDKLLFSGIIPFQWYITCQYNWKFVMCIKRGNRTYHMLLARYLKPWYNCLLEHFWLYILQQHPDRSLVLSNWTCYFTWIVNGPNPSIILNKICNLLIKIAVISLGPQCINVLKYFQFVYTKVQLCII